MMPSPGSSACCPAPPRAPSCARPTRGRGRCAAASRESRRPCRRSDTSARRRASRRCSGRSPRASFTVSGSVQRTARALALVMRLAPPRPTPPRPMRNTSGPEELEPEAHVVLRQHGAIAARRSRTVCQRSDFRWAGRVVAAQHELKVAAADRRANAASSASCGSRAVKAASSASERLLHRKVDDRRPDLQFGEQRAGRLDARCARRAERPVDAGVADARGEPRLLRPADVARDRPRRQRNEHGGLGFREGRSAPGRRYRCDCRARQEVSTGHGPKCDLRVRGSSVQGSACEDLR